MDQEIYNVYQSFLAMANWKAEQDGRIMNMLYDEPVTLSDGSVAYLPIIETMKNPEGKTWFHLLNEDFELPETEMYTLYKKYLVLSLNLRLSKTMTAIINIGSNPEKTRLLKSGEAIDLFSSIPGLKFGQVQIVERMFKRALKDNPQDPPFLDIFIKKKASFKGEDYTAIGRCKFKVYNELKTNFDNGAMKPFGIGAITKTESTALMSLLEAIYPNLGNEDVYVGATKTKGYRCLDALIKAAFLIGNRLNTVLRLINESVEVDDIETLMTDLSWVELMENMGDKTNIIRSIRVQSDQIRKSLQEGNTELQQAVIPNFEIPRQDIPTAQPQQTQVQQPVQTQPPVYNPGMPPVQPMPGQPVQNPQPTKANPNDIFTGKAPMTLTPYQQQHQMQMAQMAGMGVTMPGQAYMPNWMQQEEQKKQMAAYQQSLQAYYQANPAVYNPSGYNPAGMPQQPYNPAGMVQQPYNPAGYQPANYNPGGVAYNTGSMQYPQQPYNPMNNQMYPNQVQQGYYGAYQANPAALQTGGNPGRTF